MTKVNDSESLLVLRDNAKAELMQIKSVEDGITYFNKLKSIEVWVKAEKKDAELQNIIAEQKLRTQRVLGELIAEGQRTGAIKTQATAKSSTTLELDDIGLNKKQSSTFQQIAEIPEETFEQFIQEKKEAVNNAVAELTTSGAVRLAKSLKQNSNKTFYDNSSDYTNEVATILERINALPIAHRIEIKNRIRIT